MVRYTVIENWDAWHSGDPVTHTHTQLLVGEKMMFYVTLSASKEKF